MIPKHDNGRMHVGALFKEAADHCTDECGTGTVCFTHMTERLREVADKIEALESQRDGIAKLLDCHPAFILETIEQIKEQRDRHVTDMQRELANANQLNSELTEAKGNLLDFIANVRIWAAGQSTGKSIVESCTGIIEKYALKQTSPVTATNGPCPSCKHFSWLPHECECECHKSKERKERA